MELTFAKVFAVAIETEEAVKVAKEMAYGSMGKQTEMVNNVLNMSFRIQQPTSSPTQGTEAACQISQKGMCPHSGS